MMVTECLESMRRQFFWKQRRGIMYAVPSLLLRRTECMNQFLHVLRRRGDIFHGPAASRMFEAEFAGMQGLARKVAYHLQRSLCQVRVSTYSATSRLIQNALAPSVVPIGKSAPRAGKPVNGIADDRMTQVGQMDADLMRATGLQFD